MDTLAVVELISKGETATVEFKRAIDLGMARGKAEFIKDITALANSADDVAYMLVGIDDNKLIIGTEEVEDERLQHIIRSYISPSPVLACHNVPLPAPQLVVVGVIEIRSGLKPHKIAKSIEHVQQNKVYVRRGTVVMEASPEEIIAMHGSAQLASEVRQYIRAAQTHAKLGNFKLALGAYDEAIKRAPTIALFLSRADIYSHLCLQSEDNESEDRNGFAAFQDYSSALKLLDSADQELDIRQKRWRVWYFGTDDDWHHEFEWLRTRTSGSDLGSVIFHEVLWNYHNSGLFYLEEPAAILSEVINLGYVEARAFALRAHAHFLGSNFGLALQDIDAALVQNMTKRARVRCMVLKATILTRMYKTYGDNKRNWLEEAFVCFIEARKLGGDDKVDGFGYMDAELEYTMLGVLALTNEFGCNSEAVSANRKQLARQLALVVGRIDMVYPRMSYLIRKMVGEDFWTTYRDRFEKE